LDIVAICRGLVLGYREIVPDCGLIDQRAIGSLSPAQRPAECLNRSCPISSSCASSSERIKRFEQFVPRRGCAGSQRRAQAGFEFSGDDLMVTAYTAGDSSQRQRRSTRQSRIEPFPKSRSPLSSMGGPRRHVSLPVTALLRFLQA
jgi:hypothetical protein